MSRDRDDDGFLTRWSRRKAEARTAPPSEPEAPPAPPVEAAAPPEPQMTAEEVAALPPIETAGAEDLKAYLRKGVPSALKTLAMRRMWAANPLIRDHVDPALDYAFDWNTPGSAPWSPLGPGDDAQALADRILKGPPRPAETPATASASDAPAPAGEDSEEAAAASEAPSAPAASVAAAQDSENPPRSTQAYESQSESPSAAHPVRSTRRRHGGAVPS